MTTYPDSRGPHADGAQLFVNWLTTGQGRQVVEGYRVEGRQVFFVWPAGRPADHPEALPQ